jgi:hypothetical protein
LRRTASGAAFVVEACTAFATTGSEGETGRVHLTHLGLPSQAFYVPLGDGLFESTAATASPWDHALQHGGPPAALLARAIERSRPDESMPVARITLDMLAGIPQGRIRTETSIVRPGRRVEMVEARLWADDRLAVTATAWRIRTDPGSTTEHRTGDPVPAVPADAATTVFPFVDEDWGYGRAVEWRFLDGGYTEIGPARVWTRLRMPLVAGEDTSPLQHLLVVADSANGLSGELSMRDWLFIPPTLTVTMVRPPTTQWLLMDARTTLGGDGTGLSEARMYDELGLVASVAQPLLVARRG